VPTKVDHNGFDTTVPTIAKKIANDDKLCEKIKSEKHIKHLIAI